MPKGGGAAKVAKSMCKSAIKGAQTTSDREDNVKEAFKQWDEDGNGVISKEELMKALEALGLPKKKAELLLEEADANDDNEISYEELVDYLFQAPNLDKYFEKLKALNVKKIEDAEKIHEKYKAKFGPKMLDLESKYQKKFDKDLSPLLKKAFKFHDKDGSGILEYDESIIFFSNYASMLVQSCVDCTAETSAKKLKFIGCIDWANLLEAFDENEERLLNKVTEVLASETQLLMESYMANQDERHRAGFAVLDVSGNGMLEEAEVCKTLVPGHTEYNKFMSALGLVVSRERILEAVMQAA